MTERFVAALLFVTFVAIVLVSMFIMSQDDEVEYEVDWGPTIAAEIERQETARAR